MRSHSESPHASEPPRYCAVWTEPWLIHGFFGREGGVSTGSCQSLNLGYFVGDQPGAVDENWARVCRVFGEELTIARSNQVHGATVHSVDARNAGHRRNGDGLVTATRGVLLCVFTADCVPIHLVDSTARVIGALHAGWRGILAGIAGEGVAAMTRLGAQPPRIRVATGPCIRQCCFEVDAELADRFGREIPQSRHHRRAGGPGKAMLDLGGIIREQFIHAGVAAESIGQVGNCTKCRSDLYFSHRAAAGGTTGVQLSFIGIKP